MHYYYFPGAPSVGLWVTTEGRTAASRDLISKTLNRDSATGSNLALVVPQNEDQSCNLNTWGCQIPQLYGKDMSVFFCARVRALALTISSRELIKSLERREHLGEKALGSFSLLCWVLAWVTLLISGWTQLKDNRALWDGCIWLYLKAFYNNLISAQWKRSFCIYLSFLFKTFIRN